jgi:hypothetical protein
LTNASTTVEHGVVLHGDQVCDVARSLKGGAERRLALVKVDALVLLLTDRERAASLWRRRRRGGFCR